MIDQFLCLLAKERAFDDFKKAIINKINIIIAIYSTTSLSLGSLIEMSLNQQNININSYSFKSICCSIMYY